MLDFTENEENYERIRIIMNDKYYEHDTPAAEWAEQTTKHALDELFNATYAYRSSKEFYNLIQFVRDVFAFIPLTMHF